MNKSSLNPITSQKALIEQFLSYAAVRSRKLKEFANGKGINQLKSTSLLNLMTVLMQRDWSVSSAIGNLLYSSMETKPW